MDVGRRPGEEGRAVIAGTRVCHAFAANAHRAAVQTCVKRAVAWWLQAAPAACAEALNPLTQHHGAVALHCRRHKLQDRQPRVCTAAVLLKGRWAQAVQQGVLSLRDLPNPAGGQEVVMHGVSVGVVERGGGSPCCGFQHVRPDAQRDCGCSAVTAASPAVAVDACLHAAPAFTVVA